MSTLMKNVRVSRLTFFQVLLSLALSLSLFTVRHYGEEPNESQQKSPLITLEKLSDSDAIIYVDGAFFAEYRADYKGTPIVWPICGSNQALVTRAWPMIDDLDVDSAPNELVKTVYQNALISERGGVKDHPHHRSLWFNHGNVLGGDFWGGTPSVIKQAKLLEAKCDGESAVIRTENYWYNDKLNRNICRDERELKFGALTIDDAQTRYLDFAIEIFALEDGVVFGDTKEGSFGIRVPSPTAVTSKKLSPHWGGIISNSFGKTGDDAWGDRARWVNYVGPAEQFLTGTELTNELNKSKSSNDFPLTQIGIAVLSGPNSLAAPLWDHVRDYGLFAFNAFGQRDFEPKNPDANGAKTLNKGESLYFNFRVLFHDGSLSKEDLDQAYQEYVNQFKRDARP